MPDMLPSRRRASRSARAMRAVVALVAVCVIAGIAWGAVAILSAEETRRLCDAAVSEGVTTVAAAEATVTQAEDVLREERRGSRADHARSHGRLLAKRVDARSQRVSAAAWVPRCASRDDVDIVRAQIRATARSVAALDHAVIALRAAHADSIR